MDLIYQEAVALEKIDYQIPEEHVHHVELKNKYHTQSYFLDSIFYNNRAQSNILYLMSKVYSLNLHESQENPYLNFIPASNQDCTYLQKYKNGSSYMKHHDGTVLSFLFPLILGNFTGGDFIFSAYNYRPVLTHNCCLIFPSYEDHELTELKTDSNEYVRYSINHRIAIKLQ